MLWGLPFSNMLGLWSGHSYSSFSWLWSSKKFLLLGLPLLLGSHLVLLRACMTHGCSWVECEMPGVQCLCKWVPDDHDMVHKWHRWLLLQGSQHHPRACIQIKHLFHSLLQVVFMVNQQAHMMLQRYTKHFFFHLTYAQQFTLYFNYYWTYNSGIYFWLSINSTKNTVAHWSNRKSTINFFIIFGHLFWATKITRLFNIIKYKYPTVDHVSNNRFHIFINHLLT